jgi:hypothetical protein
MGGKKVKRLHRLRIKVRSVKGKMRVMIKLRWWRVIRWT